MYNRYIPQPDGSYRRSRMPGPPPPQSKKPLPFSPPEPQECEPPCPPPEPPKRPVSKQCTGAGDFLKQLLPKGLDTGDLLIIVLLLLMAGDCPEDQNTALLTLALYLFL